MSPCSTITDADIARYAERVIQARTGLVIPRLYRDRVEAGLGEAQAVLAAPTLHATLAALERLPCDSAPWQAAIAAITVGETSFLRHREWFAEIERTILEPMVDAKARSGARRIDIWSAACSTGEEAYSLAILVDRLVRNRGAWSVRILASDINAAALAHAAHGVYGDWALREVDADTLAQSFQPAGRGRHRVAEPLRQSVTFRPLNLAEACYPDTASGLAGFDLVLCRNVLIYLSESDQLAAARRLAASLAPGGWLAVSPAEAVADWYRPLETVNRPGAIFFRNVAPRTTARTPAAAAAVATGARMPRPRLARPQASAPKAAGASEAASPGGLAEVRAQADRGDRAGARAGCEARIAANRLDFDAHLLLATICLEMGSADVALDAARCAAYLEPDSAAAHYTLGTVLHRLGAQEAACRKMAVVLRLLQASADDAAVARHFDATAGALRTSAQGFIDVHAADAGAAQVQP